MPGRGSNTKVLPIKFCHANYRLTQKTPAIIP